MIKKLFSAVMVMAISVNAQDFKINHINTQGVKIIQAAKNAKQINLNGIASTTDTLMPASVKTGGCAPLPLGPYDIYPYDFVAPVDTGYVFGTNQYTVSLSGITYTVNVNESAQKYNVTGMASVTGVLFPTPIASSSASTTMVSAVVYNEDATTKAPMTSLGTSTAAALNSFSKTNYNMLTFSTPVSLNNQNFFISIVSPPLGGTTKDTMALLGTNAGTCSSTDSLSWVKQVINGGLFVNWFSVKTYFRNFNLDLLIFPIVNITTGQSSFSGADLDLYAASPNPSVNAVNINFSLKSTSNVKIEVYDLTGKLVRSVKNTEVFPVGKHSVSIDLTDLAPGSYLYTIQAGGAKMASKFIVTK